MDQFKCFTKNEQYIKPDYNAVASTDTEADRSTLTRYYLLCTVTLDMYIIKQRFAGNIANEMERAVDSVTGDARSIAAVDWTCFGFVPGSR